MKEEYSVRHESSCAPDDSQTRVMLIVDQHLAELCRTLHATGIGRYHDEISQVGLCAEIASEGHGANQVVEREIKEALDLCRVQVNRTTTYTSTQAFRG